jgi:hypothetical protein
MSLRQLAATVLERQGDEETARMLRERDPAFPSYLRGLFSQFMGDDHDELEKHLEETKQMYGFLPDSDERCLTMLEKLLAKVQAEDKQVVQEMIEVLKQEADQSFHFRPSSLMLFIALSAKYPELGDCILDQADYLSDILEEEAVP